MAQIALFHSALGVRRGVVDAADRFRSAGHEVLIVDQYEGRAFDTYDAARTHMESIGGYPALMGSALGAVEALPDGFVAAGFSNGGGMAEYVSTQRSVSGTLMFSGTIPLAEIGADQWPTGVPAQIHYMTDDPFRHPGWAEDLAASIRAAGALVETFEYAGDGHLFTDPSLPDDYDADAAGLLWSRALAFCSALGRTFE